MNIFKKAAVVALAITTLGVYVMPAGAQSVSDLQAQISALLAQIQALQTQLTQGSSTGTGLACYSWTRDLTLGSTGADVQALQQFLNGAGYAVAVSGAGSAGNESEYFGQLTQSALANFQLAKGITPPAGYFGSITRSYIASNMCSPDDNDNGNDNNLTSGVEITSDDLSDITVPYNAANIVMMKIMVAAGEDGTIDGLTFDRKGAGTRTDFDKLYIYQDGMKLTSGRSVNSNHQLQFTNLDVDVDGGDTVELDLVATLNASSSDSGNVHYFKLTDVDVEGVDVDGLPATGRTITLSGTAAGTLAVTHNTAADTTVELGEENVEIFNADFQANNEDVEFSRVILTQYDSADVGSLDDFVVKVDGIEVDASVSFDGDEMTIMFDDPYTIEDGDSIELSVYATMTSDAYIKGGSGAIELWIDEATDVYAQGLDYGYGVKATGTFGTAPGASYTVTIQAAELTFTHNGPAVEDVALNGEDVVLFDFDVDTLAEYEVDNITFKFVVSTNTLDLQNVRLREVGGSVVSGPEDPSAYGTGTSYLTMADNFVIDAGNTNYELVADLGSSTVAGSKVTVSLLIDNTTASYDLDAQNLETNENVDVSTDVIPASELAGKQQTVTSPDLTIVAAPSPVAQTYVVGRSGAVLGAWVLDNNTVSSIDVRTLGFTLLLSSSLDDTLSNASEAPRDLVGSLTLRKGSETGTVLDSKSVGTGTNPSLSYGVSGKLNIAAGEEETIYLIGDLKSDYADTDSEFQATLATITAKDSNNENPTVDGGAIGSYGGDTGKIFDVTSVGSFAKAEFDGSNPAENSIIVPANGVLFASYNFRAQKEDIQLRDLGVDLGSNQAAYFQNIKVYVDGSQAKSGTMSGQTKTFDDINIDFAKDDDTQVQLYADLVNSGFGTNLTSGAELQLYLTTTQGTYDAVGLDSGTAVAVTTTSLDDSVRTFLIANSYPTLTHTGSNGTLIAGVTDLYNFTVTANSHGDVDLRRLSFDVTASEGTTTTDLQVASFELLRGNTVVASESATTIGDSVTSETGEIAMNITNSSYYRIAAGQTVTFKLRGNVTNVSDSDANSVTVRISNDDESGTFQKEVNTDGDFASGDEDTVWGDTYYGFNGTYLDHPTESQTKSL
jgi:hypothetical protein